MKKICSFFTFLVFALNMQAQCTWDSEVCFTYCNDTWNGDGSGLSCFDPNEATIENPGRISYCYTSPKEILTTGTHPVNQNQFSYSRNALVHVCIPLDVCGASFELYEVVIEQGVETGAILLEEDSDLYLGGNRGTLCNYCREGGHSYFTLRSHRDPASATGTFRMELNYTCCDEEGNPIGSGSTSFYYEITEAASDVDVEIAYLASAQIEDINDDPDIDGLIPYDGAFPGPELGPASAGVRVSAVGIGVTSYTVSLYEVQCLDGGAEILIHSQTIPYNGDNEIFYSFLNIPNWENIYSPGTCYKVVTEVASICDDYEEVGYFTITSECTFCLTNEEPDTFEPVFRHSNPELIRIESTTKLREVYVLDSWGRLIATRQNINQYELDLQLRQADYSGSYLLVIVIDESGRIKKNMMLNPH